MMETTQFDRYHTVLRAAQNVTFSKSTAQKLVGGRRRLERLVNEKKIRCPEELIGTKYKRWECNGADVLRYTIDPSLEH